MNVWQNAVITTKGNALLAKLVSGVTLDITRAATGSGWTTPGLLQGLTAVSQEKQALKFNPVSYPEEGKCAVPCYLTNDGVEVGYDANQVGIYATDPDDGEILFLVAQASENDGTVIPSESEMPGYSADWTFYIRYGQADGVTVTVDPSNTVNQAGMESYVENYVSENIQAATLEEIDAAIGEVQT